ncbi:MAG: protein-disulfide reductase DsbD family protein, partial [Parachlamydiaceae bacterium]
LEILLDHADDQSYLSMADPVAKSALPEEESLGLGWALLFSLVGGLLLNLMPCVLPVVSLKVLSFVQMAGSSRKELFKQGTLFSSGVIVSFWALAGALIVLQMSGEAVGWGFQLQEPIFVALLAFLFVLLALSLFGVFEMGTSIAAMAGDASQGKTGSKSSSSFWSGVFATAVATPCTGPFMGTALGYALTQPPLIALLVFTALGLGMSLPYLLLGLNPGLLRFVPKPGDWMEAFKQMMGFLMLATVVWLLWVFAGQTSENSLFILLFALLTASISAWIYGRWGAPYKSRKTRRAAYVAAMAVLVLSFWVASGAVRDQSAPSSSDQIAMAGDGWEPFSPQRVEELRAQNVPVFIDFTAKWCLICQANHLTLTKGPVEAKMAEKFVVRMKADWTKHDPLITEELKKFGRSGVPLYVYYGSEKQDAVILPQVLTDSSIISAVEEESSVR